MAVDLDSASKYKVMEHDFPGFSIRALIYQAQCVVTDDYGK